MICVVYGTTGELIKLAPVLDRLRQRGQTYFSATTAQQIEQIPGLLEQFGLPEPDLWLGQGAGGRDLRTNRDVPGWLATVFSRFARNGRKLSRELRRGPGRPLLLVHGDTMSTVLGAMMGRVIGSSVAHIEAGLRSYDWRHPFPEELNRRAASRLARIHYAPGAWAASNLRRGIVVDTGSNTIQDSIAMCPPDYAQPFVDHDQPYGLVSLHRYELLEDRSLLARTLDVLAEYSKQKRLLFIDHPVTAAAIEKHRLGGHFDEKQLVRVPRLTFFSFISLLRAGDFLVTDSGGSQEECFYLEKPCLVHRNKTERREGLGQNVVLSHLDLGVLRDFLADPSRFQGHASPSSTSPSDVIVDDFASRGFTG